jgi:hypothetical protein
MTDEEPAAERKPPKKKAKPRKKKLKVEKRPLEHPPDDLSPTEEEAKSIGGGRTRAEPYVPV